MPGFISHTIMAKDIYNKLGKKNVSKDYMVTFSLGGDLCKFADCRYDSHHKDMDKFIYNMADYIIDNNLLDDSNCLGVLYGHICHYVMDDVIHPLVWKISKKCLKNTKNHTWIEQYYNEYLTNKIFNLELSSYAKTEILNAKMNLKITKMIDYVYERTYNTKHVSRYYRFNLLLYRTEKLFMIINAKIWYKINGVDKFIKINKNIDLTNNDLLTLYNESIKKAISYIKNIDKYMKTNKKILV